MATKMPTKKNTPQRAKSTLKLTDDSWRDKFRGSVCRIGFQLSLTRAMLEMLCAIADGVAWNRAQFPGLAVPDNWIASQAALINRGLIIEKSEEESSADIEASEITKTYYCWSHFKLSPAGEKAVEIIKLSGLFMESDFAVVKKLRKA